MSIDASSPNLDALRPPSSSHGGDDLKPFMAALDSSRQQMRHEEIMADKRHRGFVVLFMFLYLMLGASLTLPSYPGDVARNALHYAIEAIPVLISFSGFFISVLFFFSTRRAYRRALSWHATIIELEARCASQVSRYIDTLNRGPQNYSNSGIQSALAFFICITWVVLYNFFTFTTSGVIGSVISLFISTMVYVMLDIQLLKASQPIAPEQPVQTD